jgi:orotidine-5'-phosphate decarboxylase
MQDPRECLCFALDVPNAREAEHFVRLLSEDVGIFKVGLELFVKEGPILIKSIKEWGAKKIFLDLKVFDIPRTVRGAREATLGLPVDFISVHCECLRERAGQFELASKPGFPQMLGVTLITSISDSDLRLLGYDHRLSLTDVVLLRAEMAKEAGCVGVICSGREVEMIHDRCGGDFLIFAPGIRPQWAHVEQDDQSRTFTPHEAIRAGAQCIIVGRPIRGASDPVRAARMVLKEIASALENAKKER